MTDRPTRRPREWAKIGYCDSCGNDGMELYKRGDELLCDSCYVQDVDKDRGRLASKAHNDFIDDFRRIFVNTTKGSAE